MKKERLNNAIKYTAISIGIAIISMPVMFFIIFLFIVAPPEPSIAKMEKELIKNKEEIMMVVDSFEKDERETIHITDMEVEKIINKWKEKDEDLDNECYNAMSLLVKKGYQIFMKEGNAVALQRWATMDCGSGITYMFDGSKPKNSEVTCFKPLSEPNWYYYFESCE